MDIQKLTFWQKTLFKREIEEKALEYLFKPFITIVLGSRQTGKTSLLRRLMGNLVLKKEISPQQILYFDFEIMSDLSSFSQVTPEQIERVVASYGGDLKNQVFLFIDEIQYHHNPSNLLKVIFDHVPGIQLVVSGSSTFKIKEKFKDSLAGRHKTFILRPLSFVEFLNFKKKTSLIKNLREPQLPERLKEELVSLQEEFIVFGGYPKVVLGEATEEKKSALEAIFTSYVRRDIKDMAVIEETEKFNRLISLLALQIGNLVNISELSTASGLNRKTLEKYLFLLENTFIISLVLPYFTNRRKELVKAAKIYFQDTGLRNYVINGFSSLDKRPDKGSLFENAVFNSLVKSGTEELRFWRTVLQKEVDFIKIEAMTNLLPLETKAGVFTKAKVPSGLRSFINKYQPQRALVVTRDFWGRKAYNKTKVSFRPAWAL